MLKVNKTKTKEKLTINKQPCILTITYNGLAVSCFSEKKNKSDTGKNESAILRVSDHKLSVYLENQQTGKKESIPIPINNVEIEIKALENPKIKGFEKFVSKTAFTRKIKSDNPFDLRWIPNIESAEFHNGKISCYDKIDFPLTKMSIQNAVFYCNKKSSKDLKKSKGDWMLESKVLEIVKKSNFGRVGFEMGAKIDADQVQILIKQNDTILLDKVLSKSEGVEYLLKIENMCSDETNRASHSGDFHRYYEIFDNKGAGFELEGKLFDELDKKEKKPSNQKGETISRAEFCGMIFSNERTDLNDLFQASSS
jgi:hypothetical protein